MIIPTPLVTIFTLRCSSRIVKLFKHEKARSVWPSAKRRGPVPVSALSPCGGAITADATIGYEGSWYSFECSICGGNNILDSPAGQGVGSSGAQSSESDGSQADDPPSSRPAGGVS